MTTLASIGIFIDQVAPNELSWRAQQNPNNGFRLSVAGEEALSRLRRSESINVSNRVIIPTDAQTIAGVCRQAEQLTLLGDNVWVQVPVMIGGQFCGPLIRHLLAAGVPLLVIGIASKRQCYHLLQEIALQEIAGFSTPCLLELSPAMARYDTIVSVALAHHFSQVQVIGCAMTPAMVWALQHLHFDGAVMTPLVYAQLTCLNQPSIGQACSVKTHKTYQLAIN
ncbi:MULTISPECIES: hypothetical protein [Limosilactobacillus]|uniref:Uncharacterized protein n=1 Tax=Limosilactobacillus panis DSM 6035 TaxID=1423782 RepID=A0A0R1XIK2_9LACO|nr:hypothetical protein [Limosilactobacillus panis]KRM30016.1 hypothetical protein FD32_GL000739 [Limosilactobacillus panis DSM 6035]